MNQNLDFTETLVNQGIDDQMDHARHEIMENLSIRKDNLANYALSQFQNLDLNGDNTLSRDELHNVAKDSSRNDKLRAAAELLEVNYDIFTKMCLQRGTTEWPSVLPTKESQDIYDEYFAADKSPDEQISRADLKVAESAADPHGITMAQLSVMTRENELKSYYEAQQDKGANSTEKKIHEPPESRGRQIGSIGISGVENIMESMFRRQSLMEHWTVPKE